MLHLEMNLKWTAVYGDDHQLLLLDEGGVYQDKVFTRFILLQAINNGESPEKVLHVITLENGQEDSDIIRFYRHNTITDERYEETAKSGMPMHNIITFALGLLEDPVTEFVNVYSNNTIH